jgi:hypothetical protein
MPIGVPPTLPALAAPPSVAAPPNLPTPPALPAPPSLHRVRPLTLSIGRAHHTASYT